MPTALAVIEAVETLITTVGPLITQVKEALASNDPAALQASLAKLQVANDALSKQ